MAVEMSRRPLIYRMFAGSWSPTEFGLKKMAVISLILESVRWALEGRFPGLIHPDATGAPEWIKLYGVVQVVFFAAASCAAGSHIIDVIRTRNWRNLNVVGWVLYLAWWVEIGWVGGYLSGLAH
jgi:hypothetical protein